MRKILISRVNRNLLLLFLVSNVIAFLTVVFIPAKAAKENIEFLFLLNSVFVFGIIFISVITYISIAPFRCSSGLNQNSMPNDLLKKNVKLLIKAPIIGFILLLFDRMFVRGIDYSQGLRYARYDWLASASSGGGVFGVVANLLIPVSYVGIFVLITQGENIKKNKAWLIFATLIGVFGHAALNGGRSNILLAIVMLIIAFLWKRGRPVKKMGRRMMLLLVALLGFYYVAYIIQSSASMGGASLAELVELGILSLYGEPNRLFFSKEQSYLMYIVIYMLSYLYHGQWTAQITSYLNDREGLYSLTSLPTILMDKYGLINMDFTGKSFSETGAFISLPGAFYYDFGWLGVVMLTFILGVLFGLSMHFINSGKRVGTIKLIFIISILYLLILSPVLPAYGLSYFYFIMWSFVFVALYNYVIFRKKLYLI